MPLKGLELIDWSHIKHSHGPATQFPEWLNALASGNDDAWLDDYDDDSPLNHIAEFSNHQGSIYEVTPYVIPFINQLLEIISEKHQTTLLSMLINFAKGEQYPSEDNK